MASSEQQDNRSIDQILGEFRFVEPSEEELLQEFAMLSSSKPAGDLGSDQAGTELMSSKEAPLDPSDSPLLEQLSNLAINEGVVDGAGIVTKNGGMANGGAAPSTLSPPMTNPREDLKQAALLAKREGRLGEAKEYWIKYKQLDQIGAAVDDRIERVEDLSKQSKQLEARNLKLKAVELRRAGNVQGALDLMKTANALLDPRAAEKSKYKELFARLSDQVKWCCSAAKYYDAAKDFNSARSFSELKKTAEGSLKRLLADFKQDKQVPEYKEHKVSFHTQELDEDIGEHDMHITIDTSKAVTSLKSVSGYKLKVVLEWPPNASPREQERVVGLGGAESASVLYEGMIKRDLRQQKFFEHRRLKLELWLTERTLFLFSRESMVASGYLKLSPLTTGCSLKSSVRLVDSEHRRHSCVVNVAVRLRFPVCQRDAVKKEALFVHIPEYTDAGAFIDPPEDRTAYYCSYAVIEAEIARLSGCSSQDAQLKLVELEGHRDKLQLQVATGQLTMQDYLDNVRTCLQSTRKQCIDFKRANDLLSAKRLLSFVKLMEEEIAEATAGQMG